MKAAADRARLRARRPAARRPAGARAGAGEATPWCSATAPTPTWSAFADDELEAAVQVFHVRGGRVRGQRGWVVEKVEDVTPADLVEHLLAQLYGDQTTADAGAARGAGARRCRADADAADRVAAPSCAAAAVDAAGAAARRQARPARDRHAQRRRRRWPCTRPDAAGDLTTRSRGAARSCRRRSACAEAPLRIECIDVTHLQGTDVVASLVVFEDGLPRKSDYRQFAIRGGGDGISDDIALDRRGRHPPVPAARSRSRRRPATTAEPGIDPTTGPAAEVRLPAEPVRRRRRRSRRSRPPQAALVELGVTDVAVVGLAKRLEEVWLPGEPDPVILPRTSEGLYLLQRVRDEAHRFAITYHRQKRGKRDGRVASSTTSPGWARRARRRCSRTSARSSGCAPRPSRRSPRCPGIGPTHRRGRRRRARRRRRAAPAVNTDHGRDPRLTPDGAACRGDAGPRL